MLLAGDLGCFDPAWSGWIVRGGELVSPEGWRIKVNDVLATPLTRAQLSAYQAELRQLKGLDAQPEPAALPQIKSSTR